jgi:hypothetical protein
MDNFFLDIISDSYLKEALTIGFKGAPGKKATHFRLDPPSGEGAARRTRTRLVLGWHEFKGSQALPFPLQIEDDSAYNFIKAWLEDQNYGSQPDHDGDNGRGWRVYNESWGHVDHDPYAFLAIEPAWAMYGK